MNSVDKQNLIKLVYLIKYFERYFVITQTKLKSVVHRTTSYKVNAYNIKHIIISDFSMKIHPSLQMLSPI